MDKGMTYVVQTLEMGRWGTRAYADKPMIKDGCLVGPENSVGPKTRNLEKIPHEVLYGEVEPTLENVYDLIAEHKAKNNKT